MTDTDLSPTARVIAIALQKGGVGKTTTTINLASSLALLGHRVLVIDMDPQANTTKGLGITLGPDDATMYEVLHTERKERVPLAKVIKTSEFGVDVAPGHLAVREFERTGLGSGGQLRLARQLDDLTGYHFVLIDCPPALGELTTASLAAADDVFSPIGPGIDELEGLGELGNTVEDVRELLNPDLEIRYVAVCGYDGRTGVSKSVRAALRRDWEPWEDGGRYIGEIRHTVRIPEAKERRAPISVHAPGCAADEDFRSIARQIVERTTA